MNANLTVKREKYVPVRKLKKASKNKASQAFVSNHSFSNQPANIQQGSQANYR